MSTHISRRLLTWVGFVVALSIAPQAGAVEGYMAFLPNGPTGTTVVTGNAESYMRAGRDWDGTAANVVGGIAVPTLVQSTRITTWSDAAGIHFHFEVPDRTRTNTAPGTSTLACGDQIILQFSPSAAVSTLSGQERRFEIVLNSNGAVTWQTRSPNAAAKWSAAATALTPIPTATIVSNEYRFTLDISWAQANVTANADFRMALAVINDLGHSHPGTPPPNPPPPVNEASGTAFPVGMGLTPASDPFLTCGTATTPNQETANGNWIKPDTWGIGYVALPTVPPDVTLDQGPAFVLSRAIRLGRCSITNFSSIPEVTVADWQSIQQNVNNNWYKYNAGGPCQMTIWIDAHATAPGVVNRRFAAVWGRPGISPQGWYFAGVTNSVAVSGPSTPVSFVWKNPPAVAFSDHPCLRVYVLPETFTTAQQTAIDNLAADTSAAGNSLGDFENAFQVAQGTSKSAQMNFDNRDLGTCSETACLPTADLRGPEDGLMARWSPFATLHAQPGRPPVAAEPRPGGDERTTLVRLIAYGFGVADPPADNRPYMYVEDIGGLGWAVSNQVIAQLGTVPLKMQVSNPAITEKMYVNGAAVVVGSPNRRILVAPVMDVVPGAAVPKLDLSALNRFAQTALTPGQTFDTQINIISGTTGWPLWWWLVLLLILLILIAIYMMRRRPATP